MAEKKNQVAVRRERSTELRDAFTPTTFEEAMKFADFLSNSGMVPTQFQGKQNDIMSAMMLGAELGLRPMQSLQNIAVINGRPSVFGDSAKAIVMASPVCEGIEESFDTSDKKNPTAICVAKRKDCPDVTASFSWNDATRAGLAGRSGPWTQYPMRMLQMRARSFALRDQFPDILNGFGVYEEVIDIPAKGGERSFGATAPDVTEDIQEFTVVGEESTSGAPENEIAEPIEVETVEEVETKEVTPIIEPVEEAGQDDTEVVEPAETVEVIKPVADDAPEPGSKYGKKDWSGFLFVYAKKKPVLAGSLQVADLKVNGNDYVFTFPEVNAKQVEQFSDPVILDELHGMIEDYFGETISVCVSTADKPVKKESEKKSAPKKKEQSEPVQMIDAPDDTLTTNEPGKTVPAGSTCNPKLDEIIEKMGGRKSCEDFLRGKRSLKPGQELEDLKDVQVERLYKNVDRMVEMQKKGE